jgi:hypothetical protein
MYLMIMSTCLSQQCLLGDPVPMIRAAAAECVCNILRDYFELIPALAVQRLLCKLLQELAWDASSPIVRLAVVKVGYFTALTHFLPAPSPAHCRSSIL